MNIWDKILMAVLNFWFKYRWEIIVAGLIISAVILTAIITSYGQ